MKFNIGIKPSRLGITAVALKEGEYHNRLVVDVAKGLPIKDRYNRSLHMERIADGLDNYLYGLSMEGDDLSIAVEALDYSVLYEERRAGIEVSQVIGCVLSMPYTVHEVSYRTWQHEMVGKGGVTRKDVMDVVESRFPGLPREFRGDNDWTDAFLLGRFGYIRDSANTVSRLAKTG